MILLSLYVAALVVFVLRLDRRMSAATVAREAAVLRQGIGA